ncbi:MAG: tRNA (adenosine(37)-N6)-threonylcarbamoyltransferase complex ATPase subunit type 1 TsaE [bacterium]|nr:tRNA (adenosine(37)-N6)-threonylcarbamoyltransferase complex ATPase subunit type 1 TsaE [bacterium]
MTIEETQKYAEDLATSAGPGQRVFALVGNLGAGKTTFSRFFLRALGVTEPVTSPTFVIMKHYSLSTTHYPLSSAYHMDCYRLKNSEELIPLGFAEILADEKNVVLVEWADRIADALPPDTVWIDFAHIDEINRHIVPRTEK